MPAPTNTLRTAEAQAVVSSVTHYPREFGGLSVQGLIQNQGDVDLASIEIAVSLTGDGDAIVGAAQAVYRPLVLGPGAHAGWLAVFETLPAYKDVKVQVQARPANPATAVFAYRDLVVEGVTGTAATGQVDAPKISGRVRNGGAQTIESIHLILTTFAPDGSVDYVAQITPALRDVPPGQTAPFQADVYGKTRPRQVGRYEIFAEGIPRR